ncbi:thioester-containing protein 1 allele R1-like [Anopheles coustani]|uniref:thioester-containing protein 1 allele R1-like n=1 Tax=Anopheles coustani TaxID=139045 RepID=UPI002657ABF8|nr:thioester-containing protein 1 allele R1-like [Anopheles coustani]
MHWLVNQRYVTGSFPRTQDTFVGLKALTKLTEAIAPLRNDYKVQLQYQNKVETFIVETQDLNAKSYGNIPSDVEQFTVHVTGSGFGLLDVTYEYTKDLRNYKNRFDLALTQLRTNSDSELQLRVCANYIAVQNDKRSNMALVEVNFPSGYVVDNDPISGATGDSPIKKTEIRFGGASVVLYYNSLGANKNCFLITAYRRFKVSLRRPAYVLVHDYYNPKLNAIQVYELEHQRE